MFKFIKKRSATYNTSHQSETLHSWICFYIIDNPREGDVSFAFAFSRNLRDEVLGEQMYVLLSQAPFPDQDKMTKRTRKGANKVICGLEFDALDVNITPSKWLRRQITIKY